MTAQQIENMRKVLFGMIGPAALILPDSEIVAFRDDLQRRANNFPTDNTYTFTDRNGETQVAVFERDK